MVVVHACYLIACIIRKMDEKFKQIYSFDEGYWRGKSTIQKLSTASGSRKEEADKNDYCNNRCTKYIYQHQNTFLGPMLVCHYLPNQMIFIRQTFSIYHMTDTRRSRYKGSYQLATKNSKDVAQAFQWIYENTPLTYTKTLIIDDGKGFYGDTTKLMEKDDVIIQRGDPSQHRSQGIVKGFNRMLADRLFSYQYHKELEDPSKSNREWVSRLQNVVSALNDEKTGLIGMKPIDAIKETLVKQEFSQPIKNYEKRLINIGTKVRYLYEPGELEGQQYRDERRKRSTDPIWSVDVYKIKIDNVVLFRWWT